MEKILISACLLGQKVRYDGSALSISENIFDQWVTEGRVVSICPEVAAGMSIPRASSEIVGGDGNSVWASTALVLENTGIDVTAFFKRGAQITLELCRKNNIKIAILVEGSPSCGSSSIYDGRFTSKKIGGVGVTTALLKKNDIEVFNQHNIQNANKALQRISR